MSFSASERVENKISILFNVEGLNELNDILKLIFIFYSLNNL
jgi:hypothetical protein